jgi:Secretory lipase
MRALGVVLALALTGAAIALAGAAVASAAVAVPLPTSDPFYAVPASISGLPNGTVLASRPITAYAGPVPLPAQAWEVKYKTIGNLGQATATVTTIMVPDSPWTGPGARPVVSYQTAEDGVGAKCSPSYALHAGLGAGDSNSEAETAEMAVALLKGWAVIAPDYEGLDSDFLGAAGEAHGVLDGVTAALRFKPDGFGPSTPVALWGYSGGAYATSLAAQAQPAYAPRLRFAGIALGGVVADLKATFNAFNGSAFGGGVVVGFVGLNRSYPSWDLGRYLNAKGAALMASNQTDCLTDAVAEYPFLNASTYTTVPDIDSVPAFSADLDRVSPLYLPGTPTAPVYDYHATGDELAPIGPDRQLMARYCAAGVRVDHVEIDIGEHLSTVVTGAAGALDWLANRFAGDPVPDTCPAGSPRPGPAGSARPPITTGAKQTHKRYRGKRRRRHRASRRRRHRASRRRHHSKPRGRRG